MTVAETDPLLPQTRGPLPLSRSAFIIVLACLYANVFLASLDSTMVATLLGKMASDLNEQEHISWVATSYLLSCAAFQPLFGKISDVFGRKPILLFSTACFSLGCLMCGLGDSLSCLIAGRLITGIGGGGFTSLATISVSDLVSNRERGLYQGYINIFFHAGAASGGIVAGIFDSWLGWKWAFLFQVPICLLTGVAVFFWFNLPKKVHHDNDRTSWEKFKSIDWCGSALLVSSLLALMIISGTNGKELPVGGTLWNSLAIYTFAGFTCFYFWEKSLEHPIIPVDMLHNKTIFASSINCWLMSMNMFASLFYLPFYWSSVKNLSPLECGYRLIPGSIIASLTSIVAGLIIKHTSKYKSLLVSGGWIAVFGCVILFMSTKNDGWLEDSLISLPLRWGASSDITTVLVAMVSSVPSSQQALVTSIQYGFRSTGSTMGVSLASALLQYTLRGSLTSKLSKLGLDSNAFNTALTGALEDPSYAFSGVDSAIKDAIVDSYDYACHWVFAFLFGTSAIVLVAIYHTGENDLDDDK